MLQEWRRLRSFPGWSISDLGNIRNDRTRQYLKVRKNHQGIVMVGLVRDGVQFTRSVPLLVARTFLDQPPLKWFESVIHLNGDRDDCRAMNLMWRSRSFALKYHAMFNDEPYRVSVRISQTGERFYSLREACTTYGLIERMAYLEMMRGEPSFPYSWNLERWDH